MVQALLFASTLSLADPLGISSVLARKEANAFTGNGKFNEGSAKATLKLICWMPTTPFSATVTAAVAFPPAAAAGKLTAFPLGKVTLGFVEVMVAPMLLSAVIPSLCKVM